jgi:hypothetical protein
MPKGSTQHGAMNFLLAAMVVLIWFLMNHHTLLVHAP